MWRITSRKLSCSVSEWALLLIFPMPNCKKRLPTNWKYYVPHWWYFSSWNLTGHLKWQGYITLYIENVWMFLGICPEWPPTSNLIRATPIILSHKNLFLSTFLRLYYFLYRINNQLWQEHKQMFYSAATLSVGVGLLSLWQVCCQTELGKTSSWVEVS